MSRLARPPGAWAARPETLDGTDAATPYIHLVAAMHGRDVGYEVRRNRQ